MQVDVNQLNAELEKLRAENAALKKVTTKTGIKLKISDKGCLVIYHGGRFPVSLYRSQVENIFSDENVKTIRDFVKANEDKLPLKAA